MYVQSILIGNKKFTEREYLHKKCAKVGKSYRTGHFVKLCKKNKPT